MKLSLASIDLPEEAPSAPSSSINWSPQQLAGFAAVEDPNFGSIRMDAVAGAGKTTFLIESARRMKGRVALVAFNRKIADEFKVRIKLPNLTCGTLHSFGLKAWKAIAPDCVVDGDKLHHLCDELHVPYWAQGFTKFMVSQAKSSGIKWPLSTGDWQLIADHFDAMDKLGEGWDSDPDRDPFEQCNPLLKASIDSSDTVIDFDDMLYMPLCYGTIKAEYDWILVDEAQDTNRVRRMLVEALLLPNGRVCVVGDPCQPAGTQVSVVQSKGDRWHPRQVKQVCIEDLVVGDTLVGYDEGDCAYYFNRKVDGITKRPYHDELIVATTLNAKSRYTLNHHCLASFSPLRHKTALYLMRKGSRFRLGRAKMDYGDVGSGPIKRAMAEGADALWILEVFDTDQKAAVYETIVQAVHGIPDITFKVPANNSVFLDEIHLEMCWEVLEQQDLTERAARCLEEFGRRLEYPIWIPGGYASFKRPSIYQACNLLDGCWMLPYLDGENHVKQEQWETAAITREPYEGFVYSLSVSHNQLYVADRLVTHNCQAIYGFTGADAHAMDNLESAFSCSRLPLTITYRCPKVIVKHARNWVHHIEAAPTAPDGTLREISAVDFDRLGSDSFTQNDAILCRNTRPLVSLALALIRRNISCRVEGRDIGQSLLALVNRWKTANTLSKLQFKLEAFQHTEGHKLRGRGQQQKAAQLDDKINSLIAVMESLGPSGDIASLRARINSLFGDTEPGKPPRVCTLSTIHKAKGREWDRVYLLGRNELMPSKWARQDWELQQEKNLIYVAVTRAKRELVEVEYVG